MNLKINPIIADSISTAKPADSPTKAKNLKELRQSTQEFEAIYINEMYKAMRKNIPESGLFKEDNSSKIYKEMLDMEMARTTASGKGMGLGEAMYNQLKDNIK